jgi:molecular chaperone GrpE
MTERQDPRQHPAAPDAQEAMNTAAPDAQEAMNTDDAGESTDDRLDLLQSEIQLLNDRHLRLAAEFDNYRKRTERERGELRARLRAEVVVRLLDGLDDLERVSALEADSTSAQAVLDGVRLVEKKFRQSLEGLGVEEVEAEGAAFDPAFMEALAMVPAERPEEDGLVADVFQRGYRLGELLIRPARVRVKQHGG